MTTVDRIFPDTEMGRLCRDMDWASTPLGPVTSWPAALRTAIAMVLRQGMPQSLCWGPDLRQIYNDAYRPIMGDKHPAGLGMPVLENWAEVAADVGPLFARVLAGDTVYFEDLPLRINRSGRPEDVNFTFSYSPVLTEAGDVCGALINCFETTASVVGRAAQAERDRLLDVLKVEGARLEGVFRQSPSFLAILRGPDNVFEMVNDAYEQIIGHGRNVVGKPLFEAIPETRGQGFDRYLSQVRETGEPLVFRSLPVKIERTSGAPLEERYIDITYLPLIEPDGTHSAVIAHGTDVTDAVVASLELQMTNQQLQDQAAELESQTEELQITTVTLEERTQEADAARRTVTDIIDAVTDGFVAFDRDLRYTYVNARAEEMWGVPATSLTGRTPMEVWPDTEHSPFVVVLRSVLASGRPEVLESYATSLAMPIELRAYPSSAGGLVVFFADVTERRRAQDATEFLAEASRVLASSGDYQTTLTNLAESVVPRLGDWCAVDVLADPDSSAWPPSIERVAVVHQDPAKISLAQNLTTDFPQDWSRDTGTPSVIRRRQPMFLPEITDAMIAAGAQSEAHAARLAALHIRSVIIVPLTARARVLGALTLVMSESERRFTNADLRLAVDLGQRAGIAIDNARLLRNADEANAVKTEFLRTISHELRQPLNAIAGYIDLWKLGLRGDIQPDMLDDIERLTRNQEHLRALIEDLLSFTRMEAGQLTFQKSSVSVHAVFTALDAMVRPQMALRGVAFSYDAGIRDLAVLGDEDRIVQICLNLLTNAMRATERGGHVSLECVEEADAVTMLVKDSGVGIPADKLEAIFAPFTQLGRSLNAPKEGAGLGLAISRGLAKAMGGTLSVDSVPGLGSTFSLRLPRR